MEVVLNTRTGETGNISAWVSKFTSLWKGGQSNINEFMDLLSSDVRLIAPGFRTTVGRAAGLSAFARTFDVLPDLTASVVRWSANDDVLFVEMTFSATIGRRQAQWYNVDRFIFLDGLAVERVAFYNPNRVRREFLKSPAGCWQLFKRLRSGL